MSGLGQIFVVVLSEKKNIFVKTARRHLLPQRKKEKGECFYARDGTATPVDNRIAIVGKKKTLLAGAATREPKGAGRACCSFFPRLCRCAVGRLYLSPLRPCANSGACRSVFSPFLLFFFFSAIGWRRPRLWFRLFVPFSLPPLSLWRALFLFSLFFFLFCVFVCDLPDDDKKKDTEGVSRRAARVRAHSTGLVDVRRKNARADGQADRDVARDVAAAPPERHRPRPPGNQRKSSDVRKGTLSRILAPASTSPFFFSAPSRPLLLDAHIKREARAHAKDTGTCLATTGKRDNNEQGKKQQRLFF